MNVLITGAGGFIGSHLTQQLMKRGYNVKAMVHYNSNGSNGWLDTIKNKPEIVSGDIRDIGFVRNVCKSVDVVYHLAALIGIPYSYIAPQSYIDTNVLGTLNILEACKNKRVMVTSTSEVYGSAQYIPMDELHPKNAQSPYAASKVAADALALSYHKSFATPVTVIRPFNTYGPRQSMRAVIPQIIIQSLANKDIFLGNTTATRDFNYVHDTVDGMIQIMADNTNIGLEKQISTGSEISIRDLAYKITDKTILDDTYRIRPEKSEVSRLCGKYDGMAKILLDTGLKETIEWFIENKHLYKDGYTV